MLRTCPQTMASVFGIFLRSFVSISSSICSCAYCTRRSTQNLIKNLLKARRAMVGGQVLRLLFFLTLILFPFVSSCSTHRREEMPAISDNWYPPKAPKKGMPPIPQSQTASPLIIVDAGHGGVDEGAKVHSFQEKRITLTTALLLKKYLDSLGYRVILTRTRDVYIPLPKRVAVANKTKGALFVSIHYNASKSKEARGIEVFYSDSKEPWRTQASKRLASSVLSGLIDETEAISRGVKLGNFHVIRETNMPAVLVEGGFVTNGDERTLLRDRDYLEKVAKGIAEGIEKYLKS